MNNKEIGEYLQQKRKECKMTQSDLAKKMNVTYQAVSRWETGDSIPDIQTLSNLADLYKVSIDEILQREHISSSDFELNEENIVIIITMVCFTAYAIGLGLFFGFSSFDLANVGLLGFFLTTVAALFLQNMYYVALSEKSKKDFIFYLVSYIPLVISLMVIAIQ